MIYGQGSTPDLRSDYVARPFLQRLIGAAALAFCLVSGEIAQAETRTGEVEGYRYRLFVPDAQAPAPARPLVVVLHGCGQSGEDMVRLTRFDALAAESGFAVLYPETGPSADNPRGCWRWWAPASQLRKGGEPEVIVSMVSEAGSATGVDGRRVYAAGFSSGGAMSAILGALYPDIFAAVGVHSGMPYAAASTGSCALRALAHGAVEPESRATIAYHAQGRRHRIMPLIVVQGSEDDVVAPENAGLLIRQFARINDMAYGGNESADAVADSTMEDRIANGRSFRVRGYRGARGEAIMREVVVVGMGHAWSGGPSGEEYSDPRGPDATSLLWAFFKNWTMENPPVTNRDVATCRERYGTNFAHYWWYGRMSREEYRCDPWRWTWRRGYDGEWTEGRCP